MLSAITAILELIMPIISRIVPDKTKQAELQLELNKVLTEQSGKIYESMKDVMVADASSESPYTRSARPTIVYWSLGLISLVVVLAPFGYDQLIIAALTKVPSDLWNLMTYSVGAFVLGRSVEKSVSNYRK